MSQAWSEDREIKNEIREARGGCVAFKLGILVFLHIAILNALLLICSFDLDNLYCYLSSLSGPSEPKNFLVHVCQFSHSLIKAAATLDLRT